MIVMLAYPWTQLPGLVISSTTVTSHGRGAQNVPAEMPAQLTLLRREMADEGTLHSRAKVSQLTTVLSSRVILRSHGVSVSQTSVKSLQLRSVSLNGLNAIEPGFAHLTSFLLKSLAGFKVQPMRQLCRIFSQTCADTELSKGTCQITNSSS